jgi:hypothetical protein
MNISYNEAMKEIRKEARKVGLVFKRKNTRLNGVYLWKFEDARRGDAALDNCQFWTAYENICSGYIGSFNSETGRFDGI